VAVYLSVIILSILLAMVLGLMTVFLNEMRMIKGMGDSVVAFYAADSGIEEVLYKDKLCRQPNCDQPPVTWVCIDTINCDDGILRGSFSTGLGLANSTTTFDDGATKATSTGEYRGNMRALQVTR